MPDELKPCPFCASEVGIVAHWRQEGAYAALCLNNACPVHFATGTAAYSTPERAVECANTRPLEDALRAELNTLREIHQDTLVEVDMLGADRILQKEKQNALRARLTAAEALIGILKMYAPSGANTQLDTALAAWEATNANDA